MDEILKCDHSSESYWAVVSFSTVYYAVQGCSNFWVCGWNPSVTIQMKAIDGISTRKFKRICRISSLERLVRRLFSLFSLSPRQVIYKQRRRSKCGLHFNAVTPFSHVLSLYTPLERLMYGKSNATDKLFASHNGTVMITRQWRQNSFAVTQSSPWLTVQVNFASRDQLCSNSQNYAPTQLKDTCEQIQTTRLPLPYNDTVLGEYHISQYFELTFFVKA